MAPDLGLFVVPSGTSIRDAMAKIEENKHRVVLVVDREHRLLGTVSDGDVRRALLKDVLTMAPVDQIMNINCRTSTEQSSEKLARLIRKLKVTVLPIVNDQNRLVDVYVAYEPSFSPEKPRTRT